MRKNNSVWSSETNLLKTAHVCDNQPMVARPFLLHELLAYSAGQYVLRFFQNVHQSVHKMPSLDSIQRQTNPPNNFTLHVSKVHNVTASYPQWTGTAQSVKCLAKGWMTRDSIFSRGKNVSLTIASEEAVGPSQRGTQYKTRFLIPQLRRQERISNA
jgi:hypothetical protein